MFGKDARDYQILFLGTFLCLGIATRDWTIKPDLMAVIIITCLLSQVILNFLFTSKKINNTIENISRFFWITSWKSALITALGLCLLLRANHYTTVALAASLAIGSKFIFRFNDKHFFNPANFGIIAALTFTQDAWVSPGQWGTDWWYLLLFLGTGGIILKRVGRWETSAIFLVVYTLLEAIRNYWLGWSLDVLQHQLMSGSLLLFTLFMLTDPRSIPNSTGSRLIWAIAIAFLAFMIQHVFYTSTAIFWALFVLSPLTILLDYWRNAPRFSWQLNSLKTTFN